MGEGRGGYILVAWGQSTGAGSLEDDPTWPLPEFIIPQDGGWVGLGFVLGLVGIFLIQLDFLGEIV